MIYFWSANNLLLLSLPNFPPVLTPTPNIPPPLLYLYLILKNQPEENAQNLMDENKKEMYDKDLSHQH